MLYVISVVLQVLLALLFLMSGSRKLKGSQDSINEFVHLGLPRWFRLVAGVVELVAVASLVIGIWSAAWAAIGALLIGAISLGGIIAMLRVKEPFRGHIVLLVTGLLAIIVLWINASGFLNFLGF